MSVIPGSVFLLHNLQMHLRERKGHFEKWHIRIFSFLPKVKPHLDLISQTFHGAFMSDVLFKPIPVSPKRDFHPPVTGLITETLNALLSSPEVGGIGTLCSCSRAGIFCFCEFQNKPSSLS